MEKSLYGFSGHQDGYVVLIFLNHFSRRGLREPEVTFLPSSSLCTKVDT